MRISDIAVTVGIILKTEKLAECITFYGSTLGLPVWFTKENLVCFRFGSGYLMVESGGAAEEEVKSTAQNPTVLRFNVRDLDRGAEILMRAMVEVSIMEFEWGRIAIFSDPDGNVCELADAGDREFGT
jgi:lactoylglutathione lyase